MYVQQLNFTIYNAAALSYVVFFNHHLFFPYRYKITMHLSFCVHMYVNNSNAMRVGVQRGLKPYTSVGFEPAIFQVSFLDYRIHFIQLELRKFLAATTATAAATTTTTAAPPTTTTTLYGVCSQSDIF
jgi:hypothetical protein